jgi:hypothetical protein
MLLLPRALAPGDFVTVECRHEGKCLITLKVTVADTPGLGADMRVPRL